MHDRPQTASQSTIKISEMCSSTTSILIGGTQHIPFDNNVYSMKLLNNELATLHSKNVRFESNNGTVNIAGFEQSIDMNGPNSLMPCVICVNHS